MGSVIAVPIAVGLSLLSSKPSDIITFCKWLYAYCYIAACRHFTKKRFDNYDIEAFHDPVKAIFLPPQVEIDSESPQPESHLQQASDKIFFYGVNSSSERLVVWIERTLNDEAEAFLHLRLADGKVYRLCQTSGYQDSSSDAGREFTCGRLRVHYNSPMRRWRIFYNGLLRETSDQDPNTERTVYVKLALLYKASSDLFDATCDISSASLALGLAKANWKSFKPPLEKINRSLDMYCQAGSIFGTVSIDGESAERQLYLFGERARYLGDANFKPGAQFTHILGHISKNGSIFHLIEGTIPGIAKELRFGFVVHPTGDLVPISDVDPQFRFSEDGEAVVVDINAEGMEFRVRGRVAGNLCHFENGKGFQGSLNMDCLDVRMNGAQGSGFLYKEKILKLSDRRTDKLATLKGIPKEIPFAVQFSEDKCELSDITGGKGSSLGKLTGLSKKFKTFIVPNGIVVTTSAYEAFVNEDILKEIRNLEAVTYKKKSGDVKEACQRVMDEVVKANVADSVHQAIVKCLNKTFGELTLSKKFAVRSSATGEDTEQMSAAGQMETFLGIKGTNEIILAVKKCWASQFSFTAVQYKRQYGQVLNSPMAVVIQEMIPCDVAGVLFTCDPLNGNPAVMSITANYGLGETVVSASEEPDTIVLRRDEDDRLEIKDKIIGAKSHRIVVGGDEGTRVEEVNEAEKGSCCLSDALALRLGNIAVQIEKSYRSSRDIEWGFWNNNLYLFQSRPVTSGCGETDYEIDHEIDFPKRIENEYFSVSNIGEVMPGAMSPLGYDVVYKFFFVGHWKKSDVNFLSKPPMYFYKTFGCVLSHAIFSIIDFMDLIREGQAAVDSVFFSFFGRLLDDKELYEAAYDRHGWMIKKKPFIDLGIFKQAGFFFNIERVLKRGRKLFANYHVPVERMVHSKDVFDTLMLACTDLSEALRCNTFALYSSGRWNYFIMKLLAKARGGYTQEVYQDFSKLLTSISGVESADVPSAMQNLAQCIGKEMNPEDFKKKDSEEILQWLKTSQTAAGKKFREFLVTHGHRCLKEFDIRSATWSENPKLLIGILKNLVGNLSEGSPSKTHQNINNLVDSLGENLTFFERLLLKYFLLPGSRKIVSIREASKSLLIKQVDAWRKAYKYLARLMVSEGRIPDEDLMFFMNLEEIKEILSTRSPRIISKATHRRRRYPILDEYIFPEIAKGVPKPINADDTPVIPTEDNFKMQGIPVSQGVAKGFVRVALTSEEASHLKRGEILLTYCTDIGWTPYFPSLAGVVTELGGLISHGAVVSREYGLPCIAGLHGATRQFQTGDYVLLDGNKGILQKIPPP